MYGRQFKTSQSFISNKKVNINIDITDNLSILNRDNTEQKLLLFNKPFLSVENKYVIENNILTVSDFNGIVTKIEFNGLKRKDSDTRDFVGEIASYQDELIKVDRTNSDNPTVQFLYFNNSQYKDNYEREERMKLAFNPFDML